MCATSEESDHQSIQKDPSFLHANSEDSDQTKLTAKEEISDCFAYNILFIYVTCFLIVVILML